MSGAAVAEQKIECAVDYQEFVDPLEHWLKANGVDWDHVIAWPQIELDRELGVLKVEQFHLDDRGRSTIHRPGSWTYTGLHEYPLAVEPDPAFWAAYSYSRPIAKRYRELEQLGREIRSWGLLADDRAPVTMVTTATGDTLMFLAANPIPNADAAKHAEVLKALLPGVQVLIVSGFETVLHKKADR
jgi:hypothetical protein